MPAELVAPNKLSSLFSTPPGGSLPLKRNPQSYSAISGLVCTIPTTLLSSQTLNAPKLVSNAPAPSPALRKASSLHSSAQEQPEPRYPVPLTVHNIAMDDGPGPAPSNAPAPVVVDTPAGPKHDDFYKYWDRFMQVKEKGKSKHKRKVLKKEVAITEAKARSGSTSSGRIPDLSVPVFKDGRREGPSLEKDVEGRPGHPVRSNTEGVISRQKATTSYEEAVASCKAKVEAIKNECRRLNQKYYDRLFDLPTQDTLLSIGSTETPHSVKPLVGVGSVKRVEDIYEEPEFFIDGATANDIRQGTNGDCWFLAAITALSGKPELIERICVARDEQVGVYGFVFFRDGEWISEVVDDRLCLRQSDDSKNYHTEYMLTTSGDQNPMSVPLTNMSYGVSKLSQEFRDSLRKGSNALYFASCKESDETWLPLLEKAYAKAHGDYQAIEGGFAGEGIEDLTGGIATYITSEDVLDKDRLWSELLQVNDKFLFGCGSRQGRDYDPADDEGFVRGHAYTVLEAKEINKPKNIIDEEQRIADKAGRKYTDKKRTEKLRMLKLRNPWGRQEWNGKWSDGSKEWTPEVMAELKHTFGDDGIFWIAYLDFLKFYPEIDRIRLIGQEWTVTQQWTAVNVPFTADYLDTTFSLRVTESGPVVLVLSQPDDRYFQGFVGRFNFDLHFRLYKDGEETYLLRSMESSGSSRSCSAELDLEPGNYTILVKISATRYQNDKTAEETIKAYRESRREKLIAVGKSFDLVHSKGKLRQMEENEAKAEKAEDKDEDKQQKRDERAQKRKERQRERARRMRRVAEEKRKKEEKAKAAKEKKRVEKEEKRRAAEEKKRTKEAEAKNKAEQQQAETDAAKQPGELKTAEVTTTEGSAEEQTEAAAATKVEDVVAPEPDPASANPATSSLGTEGKDQAATKAAEEKDSASIGTSSTGAGQPTPESTPEPSADGKETAASVTEAAPATTPEGKSEAAAGVEAGAVDAGADAKTQATDETSAEEKKSDSTDVLPATDPGHDTPGEENEPKTVVDVDEEQESCHSSDDEEPVSDVSTVADSDFEWDSAIDGSGDSESDSESDGDSDDDLFKDDPWNARCVIGLRVCSLDRDVSVGVRHGRGGPWGHENVEETA